VSRTAVASGQRTAVTVTAVIAIVVTAANLRPAVTSAGALLRDLQAATGMSTVEAGVLTSLPPICFGVFGLLGARLGRRVGTAPTMIGAMLLVAVSLVARATSDAPMLVLAWTVPALAGMAVGNVLLPVAVKRWFPHRVGAATGWYSVGLALGTAAAAGLSVPLATLAGSWRVGLGAWAVPALLAALPWLWLRRDEADRPPPRPAGSPTGPQGDRAIVRAVRRDRRSWALAGFFGLQSLTAYVVMGWLPTIYQDAGVAPETAGLLLAVVMALGAPVSLLLPVFAGRRADQRALVVTIVVCAAIGFSGLLLAPAAGRWVWAVLIGVGMGAFPLALVLIGLRAATSAGTAELSSLGQGAGYLLAAGGPVAIGLLRDATGTWTPPLLVLLGLLIPQLLCGLAAARPGQIDT
jgi:MFS transporter, CP family, cyanate transporter